MNSVVKISPVFVCVALLSVCEALYSAAEAVSERDLVTGQRTLSMASRGQQISQGNAAVEQIIAEQKKAGKKINASLDAAAYQRVVRVFDRIHRVSHLANERWQPVLIDDPSFNAFTTGEPTSWYIAA